MLQVNMVEKGKGNGKEREVLPAKVTGLPRPIPA